MRTSEKLTIVAVIAIALGTMAGILAIAIAIVASASVLVLTRKCRLSVVYTEASVVTAGIVGAVLCSGGSLSLFGELIAGSVIGGVVWLLWEMPRLMPNMMSSGAAQDGNTCASEVLSIAKAFAVMCVCEMPLLCAGVIALRVASIIEPGDGETTRGLVILVLTVTGALCVPIWLGALCFVCVCVQQKSESLLATGAKTMDEA